MRESFVADASIAASWVLRSQANDLSRELFMAAEAGSAIHVPALWSVEIANTLLMAVRRQRITDEERRSAMATFWQFNIVIDNEATTLAWTTISDIAVTYTLSVYDAVYLELAMRKQLPLATRDSALQRAAQTAGVELL